MTPDRFDELAKRCPALRVIVLGDFCLDRYLDIDPVRGEISIETGLPVHNVTGVRSQPGAAGTILNNLVALEVGAALPLGFCGEDGEGWELLRALRRLPLVNLDRFVQTAARRTFTYTKPLIHEPGQSPRELSRLDLKNWSPTPPEVEDALIAAEVELSRDADAIIVMDQVDLADTGVVTARVRDTLREIASAHPALPILADCRRGLRGWPSCIWKMNARELSVLVDVSESDRPAMMVAAAKLARANGRPIFVTLAGHGILGADASGQAVHVPAFPVHGEIDIVGAGDAVSANLVTALAAGARMHEAMEMAMAAASIVIHQVGTTGTASMPGIRELLFPGVETDKPKT
jgi:rfaE bifunctional protein kinase chain/domain